MAKWCIDYDTMNKCVQRLKMLHPRKYLTVNLLEYFVYMLFEKGGFWIEEDSEKY